MEKNQIFKKFISHHIIKEKYELDDTDIPNNITSGLASTIPIIKTIAILVNELEDNHGINNVSLYNKISIYLNQNI
jgi:hypothetical protein